MLSSLLFFLGINLAFVFDASSAAPAVPPTGSCADIFREANISRQFAPHVGHAIHSINVEALREFERDFDAVNFIPTVDLDLLSATPILPHAPMPEESDFKTQGMRVLDRVLSHMSNPSWEIKNYNALERLVHRFHMHEKWYSIRGEYANVKLAPPSQEVCQCALDETNNGILKMLRFITLALREPELVYGSEGFGNQKDDKGKSADGKPNNLYFNRYNIHLKDPEDEAGSDQINAAKVVEKPSQLGGKTIQYNIASWGLLPETDKSNQALGPKIGPQQDDKSKPQLGGKSIHFSLNGYGLGDAANVEQTQQLGNANKNVELHGKSIHFFSTHYGLAEDASAAQEEHLGGKSIHPLREGYFGPIPSEKAKFQGDQFNLDTLSLDKILKDNHESFPGLQDEDAWKVWHGSAKTIPEGDRDAAVYLYCAHQRANRYKHTTK